MQRERPSSGEHTFEFDKRSTYTGEWHNGLRHGRGTMSFVSGKRFCDMNDAASCTRWMDSVAVTRRDIRAGTRASGKTIRCTGRERSS